MDARRTRTGQQRHFSFRRAVIFGCVVFAHGLLGLLLLAPATPRVAGSTARSRSETDDAGLILIFLDRRTRHTRTSTRHARLRQPTPRSSLHTTRRAESPRHSTTAAAHVSAMHAAAPALRLDLPTSRSAPGPVSHQVPRYIAGGRALQQELREAKRRAQRSYLPDDTVPGAPHFAMRDPRTEGVAGVMRLIQHHLIGVADPACVEAGTAVAMSKQQQAERHIDMDAVAKTIFEHHCVMQPHSWLAPDGPAVHLTARPPGHGMQ